MSFRKRDCLKGHLCSFIIFVGVQPQTDLIEGVFCIHGQKILDVVCAAAAAAAAAIFRPNICDSAFLLPPQSHLKESELYTLIIRSSEIDRNLHAH